MIYLTIAFILTCYILKLFFPEQFLMIIENEQIVKIGMFVGDREWLHIMLACITSFITYWLYICAVTRKWYINWKELILIAIAIATTQIVYNYDYTVASSLSLIFMIVVPAFSKAELKDVAVVFTVHCLAQILSTKIRNLPFLLTNINYATVLLLGLECYFWLLLFYFYNNYKEKKND